MMKKFKLFLLAFIAICAFVFLINPQAKADDATVSTIDGASIRLTEPSGLRFIGQVTGNFTGTTVKYGFLLSKGDFTASQMQELYEHSYAKAVDAGELDGEGKFYVSIVNIPASGYDDDICALAYVDVDGVKTYATTSCTRNIEEVISAIDPAERNDFMNKIMNTSTFNLNGGQMNYKYTFKITRCGDFGSSVVGSGYYLGIGTKANYSNVCNYNWDRLYVDYDSSIDCYRVVAKGTAPENYDYVIAVHSSCQDAASRTAFRNALSNAHYEDLLLKFTYPTSKECNQTVIVDFSSDKLHGNKYYVAASENLPTASKDYYDFAGWYDNAGLNGSAISVHQADESVNYYAKWTPTNYTINYELQGGSTSESLVTNYNYESSAIALPSAGTMSIANGTFKGWYDNASGIGTPITSIPTGSNGNKIIYACWDMDVIENISLGSIDIAALNSIYTSKGAIADIIVKPGIENVKYTVSGEGLNGAYSEKQYVYSITAFTTIESAIEAATDGQKIYVFAGTYSDQLTVNKSLLIVGPNVGINGNAVRNTEAELTALVTISANNVEFNGFKLTSNGDIRVSANNVTIDNCYIKPSKTIVCDGGNRQGCIVNGSSISNLSVLNTYICAPGATQSYTTQYMSFGTVTNLTISGCYLTNAATTLSGDYAGMMIYNCAGIYNITNNEFRFATTGYTFFIGQASNSCTKINIVDNIIGERDGKTTATLRIGKGTSSLTTNITHNKFINCVLSTYNFGSDAGSTINISYNYYNNQQKYGVSTVASAHLSLSHNYYEGEINSTDKSGAASEATKCSSLNELEAAYVDYLISQIGAVEATAVCKAKIDKAREFYDALTEAQKALVTSLSTLTTAESTYEGLVG